MLGEKKSAGETAARRDNNRKMCIKKKKKGTSRIEEWNWQWHNEYQKHV